MYFVDIDGVKKSLQQNTISHRDKVLYGIGTLTLAALFTSFPLYVIHQLFGYFWSSVALVALSTFLVLSYLASKSKSLTIFFTKFTCIGFPIAFRILLYYALICLGLAFALLLIIGPKFMELLYLEQIVQTPNIPILEPLILKLGNQLHHNTNVSPSTTIEDKLSQKAVDSVVSYSRQGLFFILLALSILPALWFYLWLNHELKKIKNKKI